MNEQIRYRLTQEETADLEKPGVRERVTAAAGEVAARIERRVQVIDAAGRVVLQVGAVELPALRGRGPRAMRMEEWAE